MNTTVKILKKARRLIERNGLNQNGDYRGKRVTKTGRTVQTFCVYGATHKAGKLAKTVVGVDMAEELLRDTLRETTGDSAVAWWNDLPTTSKKDVLELFDAAIAKAGA